MKKCLPSGNGCPKIQSINTTTQGDNIMKQETTMQYAVDQRVCNVHRPENIGTIVEVVPGCNTLVGIVFDGRDFTSWLPVQDVASTTL